MVTKTNRILSYLPSTFRTQPPAVVLKQLVDTFGQDLLKAENSLAEILAAHFVDYADRAASGIDALKDVREIDDLARIAALYGLAPRREADLSGRELAPGEDRGPVVESVEAFRRRLKRYVRIFLEGTVTIQGILRIAAEALALEIADAPEELEAWWQPRSPVTLTTPVPHCEDVARVIFGTVTATAIGQAAQPAQIVGQVVLGNSLDLQGATQLYLQVNGEAQTIDLSPPAGSEETLVADAITAINDAFSGAEVARLDNQRLTLTTPTLGAGSRLTVMDGENDAALALLGLAPYDYRGSDAAPARVEGTIALAEMLDLTNHRYLRLEVDRSQTVEIDCANPDNPAQTTPAQVQAAINVAVGTEIASLNAGRLILTSPTVGFNSSIALQRPAAQEATDVLLGVSDRFFLGRDAQPAQIRSRQDLSGGVDLSRHSQLRFRVDNGSSLTVDGAGDNPANTQLFEITNAINTDTGRDLARQDGQFLTLRSPTLGASSRLTLEPFPEGDAITAIFGVPRRAAVFSAATAARLAGTPDIAALVDLNGPRSLLIGQLKLSVDGGSAQMIPLRIEVTSSSEPDVSAHQQAVLDTLMAAINQVYPDLASHDGQQLSLTSPTLGSASRLDLLPIETLRSRAFVTRVAILNDAVRSLFGRIRIEASGTGATSASLVGTVDLSRGKDLSVNRYLRIQVDAHLAFEVDCAGLRPRVTSLEEIVSKINTEAPAAIGDIASAAGRNLILTSPTSGADSRIVLEPPQSTDALSELKLSAGAIRGQDATRVTVVGTVALRGGVDLPADAALRLQVDGDVAVTIALTTEATRLNLDQIVLAINRELDGVVAQTDGEHLILTSANDGPESVIAFDVPEGIDVTEQLLGFAAPRRYQGQPALSAEIRSQDPLSPPLDLSVESFLNLTVDSEPSQTVDVTAFATAANTVSLDSIMTAINEAFGGTEIATVESNRLVLRSPSTGLGSRLLLVPHTGADAAPLLFGDGDRQAQGTDPAPAVLTGDVDLTSSVDLSQGSQLRLQVNDQRPVDIDVVGAAPANTFGDEVAAAINAVYPDMAAVNDDGQLQLTAPTTGEASRLAVFPQRYLELIEYLPTPVTAPAQSVRHGDRWSLSNDGVADATATITLHAPNGTVGPTLVNTTTGWQLRVLEMVDAGETLVIEADESGLRATIYTASGEERPVNPDKFLSGPIGTQVLVPFSDAYSFRQDAHQQAALQLNEPLSDTIIRLKAAAAVANNLTIRVQPHDLETPTRLLEQGDSVELLGRLRLSPQPQLVDVNGDDQIYLRAGAEVDLEPYNEQVVSVRGPLYGDQPPLLEVHQIHPLFDVTVNYAPADAAVESEPYLAVTIGPDGDRSLFQQVNAKSQWLTAERLSKAEGLRLPRGISRWQYLDCYSSRFNYANFDHAYFVGDRCRERGIFNISRFRHIPPELVEAVFTGEETDPPVIVSAAWRAHQPGSFELHLPADLPERFGGRFNQTRFSQVTRQPELYPQSVLETTESEEFNTEHFLVSRINTISNIVTAALVDRVPLGWQAVTPPFRRPQLLTLGSPDAAARLYLENPDAPSQFIQLEAKAAGTWGNEIAISVRSAGAAMYDVAIAYQASRFENARQVVLGPPLSTSTQELLKPGPVGVLQAKAAGVRAIVTRDTCHP